MQNVYAEVGSCLQQLGGSCPPGWTVMQGLRPAPDMVAQRDGSWTAAPADPKLAGVEFEGVMCSATKEDMWGLSSVAPWIAAGNSTAFEFDNGNVLVLTPANYLEFTQVWGAFRASFFPVP